MNQEMLKSALNYDPETGLFVWVRTKGNRITGSPVGSIHPKGYLRIKVNKVAYSAHRLAFLWMTGDFPTHEVDHINGVRDDNRWSNLRAVTHHENKMNKKLSVRNTSGVYGVSLQSASGMWMVTISSHNNHRYLGGYSDWFEAVCARKSAEVKYGFHPNHGRS